MASPRRRLVRPDTTPRPHPPSARRLQTLRSRLAHEQAALVRWQARLKRAFNQVQKLQHTIARLQRQLLHTEEI